MKITWILDNEFDEIFDGDILLGTIILSNNNEEILSDVTIIDGFIDKLINGFDAINQGEIFYSIDIVNEAGKLIFSVESNNSINLEYDYKNTKLNSISIEKFFILLYLSSLKLVNNIKDSKIDLDLYEIKRVINFLETYYDYYNYCNSKYTIVEEVKENFFYSVEIK